MKRILSHKAFRLAVPTLALAIMLISLASCGIMKPQAEPYAKLRQEQPLSILIMPPINETNEVEAQEYFYSSLMQPLVERGYYVFSPTLSLELLREESAADAELFLESSLRPFGEIFGADVVLFTIIKKWSKVSLLSTITVEVEYILKSTKSNEELFRHNTLVRVDTSTGLGGLLGIVADLISTGLTDKVVAARKANEIALSVLPVGRYSPHWVNPEKEH